MFLDTLCSPLASPRLRPRGVRVSDARARDAGEVLLRRLLAAAALSVTLLVPATAGAASRAPVDVASRVAAAYWGTVPCGGQVAIRARRPLERGMARTTDAWVTFGSPLGANNLAAPASTYTDCAITFARRRWPTTASMREDWGIFCATMTHEMGHLLGRPARRHARQRDGARVHGLLERPGGLPRSPPPRQREIVSGTPAPMRLASHVIAPVLRRMQPWETAVPSAPERPSLPCRAIWPGAALELLQDVRAGAGRERERAAVGARGERERLLDEEPPARRRRRRVADHGEEVAYGAAGAVDVHAPGGELHGDPPRGGRGPGVRRPEPARVGVGPAGKPDAGPLRGRCSLVAWPRTGRTVRTRVSGRRAGIVSIRCERRLGALRTMWSCSSTTSGWLRGALAAAAEAGAARSASASPTTPRRKPGCRRTVRALSFIR